MSASTPMMQQYQEAKRACPDALLLFRMGDFYEMFHDDAKTAARVLNLALTSRDKGENAIPMAGFPAPPVGKLPGQADRRRHSGGRLRTGRRPQAGQGAGQPRSDPHRHARHRHRRRPAGSRARATTWRPSSPGEPVGLAWVELRRAGSRRPRFPAAQLADQLARIAPGRMPAGRRRAEPLPPAPARTNMHDASRGGRAWAFARAKRPPQTLTKHFGTATLEGFGFSDDAERRQAIRAAGAILDYLVETQKTLAGAHRPPAPYRSASSAGNRRSQPPQPGDHPHASAKAAAKARCWPCSIAPSRRWARGCWPNGWPTR